MIKKTLKAVALKYPQEAEAPFITASVKGVVAEKLLSAARENNIPIVENEELTEVLSVSEIGECIPEQTWEHVAKIFAFVVDLDKGK